MFCFILSHLSPVCKHTQPLNTRKQTSDITQFMWMFEPFPPQPLSYLHITFIIIETGVRDNYTVRHLSLIQKEPKSAIAIPRIIGHALKNLNLQ